MILGSELNVTRLHWKCVMSLFATFINGTSYGLQLNFEDTTRYENYKGVLNLFTKRWKIILVIIVNIGLREKKKTRSPNILPRSWEKRER